MCVAMLLWTNELSHEFFFFFFFVLAWFDCLCSSSFHVTRPTGIWDGGVGSNKIWRTKKIRFNGRLFRFFVRVSNLWCRLSAGITRRVICTYAFVSDRTRCIRFSTVFSADFSIEINSIVHRDRNKTSVVSDNDLFRLTPRDRKKSFSRESVRWI